MYLSKLKLDLNNSSVKQGLNVCQDMHITIMNAFKGEKDLRREDLKLLYRLQEINDEMFLYLQSAVKPDWENIKSQGFYLVNLVDLKPLLNHFKEGNTYNFNITCLPYKYFKGKKNKVFIRSVDERLNWFVNHGKRNGFSVINYTERGEIKQTKGIKRNSNAWFNYINAVGRLEITDVVKFTECFITGIGPEKSYGLGLLLLSR